MAQGDLHDFVERTRSVLAQSPDLSVRNTELRVVLPFLETLGWDVHGPDVEAEFVVRDPNHDQFGEDAPDSESGDDPPNSGGDHTDTGATDPSPGATDGRSDQVEDGDGGMGGDGRAETEANWEADDPDASERRQATITVDYALLFEGAPAAFVVTQASREDLFAAAGRRLTAAMDAADVEWGLLTNGRTYAFVTVEAGDPERVHCDLAELPDRESVVAHYTREAARGRHERRRSQARRRVAERVADRREDLVERIEERLVEAADGALAEELSGASAAFVDGLIDALSAGDRPVVRHSPGAGPDVRERAGGTLGAPDAGDGPADARDDEPPTDRGDDTPTVQADDTRTDEGGEPRSDEGDAAPRRAPDRIDAGADPAGPGTAGPGGRNRGAQSGANAGREAGTDGREGADIARRERDDGEYVVRFFNDRTSVGAVGHGTPAGATAQAVEYLIEHHALDSRLNLPWAPGDDDHAVVNRTPVHPDGSSMSAAEQLSNGYYLCTTLDVDASRHVVETLADRSGLRTMFQGDW